MKETRQCTMPRRLYIGAEAAVVTAALFTIPLVVLQERGVTDVWLGAADWAVWSVFCVALAVELYYADDRLRHLRRRPVDAAVVILSFPLLPSWLALSRLARAARLLRLLAVAGRSFPALKATVGRRELLYVCCLCLILVLSAATGLLMLEPATVGGDFTNALWWSVVTVTTVGYGDIAPATPVGRALAIVIMLAGLGVISTLSASIAAYFVHQDRSSELSRMEQRLARIEEALANLRGGRQPEEP